MSEDRVAYHPASALETAPDAEPRHKGLFMRLPQAYHDTLMRLMKRISKPGAKRTQTEVISLALDALSHRLDRDEDCVSGLMVRTDGIEACQAVLSGGGHLTQAALMSLVVEARQAIGDRAMLTTDRHIALMKAQHLCWQVLTPNLGDFATLAMIQQYARRCLPQDHESTFDQTDPLVRMTQYQVAYTDQRTTLHLADEMAFRPLEHLIALCFDAWPGESLTLLLRPLLPDLLALAIAARVKATGQGYQLPDARAFNNPGVDVRLEQRTELALTKIRWRVTETAALIRVETISGQCLELTAVPQVQAFMALIRQATHPEAASYPSALERDGVAIHFRESGTHDIRIGACSGVETAGIRAGLFLTRAQAQDLAEAAALLEQSPIYQAHMSRLAMMWGWI